MQPVQKEIYMRKVASLLFTLILLCGSPSSWADGEKGSDTEVSKKETVKVGGKRGSIVLTETIEESKPTSKKIAKPVVLATPAPVLELDHATKKAFARVIREAYRTLEDYARTGGEIRFRVSGFETLTSDQFDEIYFADISTPSDGLTLDLQRKTVTDEIKGLKTVEYTPSWVTKDNDWSNAEVWLEASSMNLREMLQVEGENEPELLGAVAVTRFDVQVAFAGRERSYKSAFLWIPGKTKDDWGVRVLDWITRGVDNIVVEAIPLAGEPIPSPPAEKIYTGDPCRVESDLDGIVSTFYIGTNDHSGGHHEAYAEFIFSCTCDQSCQSRCSGAPGYAICREGPGVNVTFWFHVLKSESGEGLAIKNNAIISGAECAAAYGCMQKNCITPFCGLSLSVTVTGVTVSFSYSSHNWKKSISAADTCFTCETIPPPSPVLINLHGPFELTGLDEAVLFDIDGDGDLNSVSWTDAEGDDAFLVLDRNGNGSIDNGTELFGSVTPQPPTADEPNGFNALSVYDRPENGGNSDGVIDAADWVFAELRLWLDSNHDAVSQPGELSTLAAAEVEEMELDYVTSQRQDRHGNEFRWKSSVRMAHGNTRPAADVIFLAQPYMP